MSEIKFIFFLHTNHHMEERPLEASISDYNVNKK